MDAKGQKKDKSKIKTIQNKSKRYEKRDSPRWLEKITKNKKKQYPPSLAGSRSCMRLEWRSSTRHIAESPADLIERNK
jgi:hypothetical protein